MWRICVGTFTKRFWRWVAPLGRIIGYSVLLPCKIVITAVMNNKNPAESCVISRCQLLEKHLFRLYI